MSAELLESVRHLPVVAVNGVFRLAPWAIAIVANDMAWWRKHPDAMEFHGMRFSTNEIRGVQRVLGASTSWCSGVLGLEVAKRLGATSIILLGADFGNGHFFGDYAEGLKNTTSLRRKVHARQFDAWRKANPAIRVMNATPNSALTAFPLIDLTEAIA